MGWSTCPACWESRVAEHEFLRALPGNRAKAVKAGEVQTVRMVAADERRARWYSNRGTCLTPGRMSGPADMDAARVGRADEGRRSIMTPIEACADGRSFAGA